VVFTVNQVFEHSWPNGVDVRYIMPNNSKICMYSATFRVGTDGITVNLEEKNVAGEISWEATSQGRTRPVSCAAAIHRPSR
jgi:hypothetical protein